VAQLDAGLLRALATYRAPRPTAITCYLDLDPGTVPTAKDLASHVTSVLDAARRSAERVASDHDTTMRLRDDLERVESYLVDELDRSGAHGLGLFVSGDHDRWSEVRLPAAVDDAAYVGTTFVTFPLLEHAERDRDVIVAAVGRFRGTLWRLAGSRMSELVDETRDGQGQHDQGGWSQARYQRSVDEDAREHMQVVADALAARIRQGSDLSLVIACAEDQRNAFLELLESRVREAVIGFVDLQKQDDGDTLAPKARAVLEERLASERRSLLGRWREEVGQRGGRATETWEDTLRAAWEGRIDVLLVDGRTEPGYECPTCGRGHAHPGRCEVDSTPLDEALGGTLELAVRGTLSNDGAVRHASRDELADTPGAATLLRYVVVPA
jgi:peptide chain release factor subunit 1